MKKILGKWQFVFYWGDASLYRPCRHNFVLGILKLVSFPAEGEMLSKANYKGFFINKYYKPFEIHINL
jgi:hypothetical protein